MYVRWINCVLAWLLVTARQGRADYMTNFRPVTDLGSSALAKSDEIYLEVQLPVPFPFYNKKYDSIFVNDDGILTFGKALPTPLGATALPINDINQSGDADLPIEQIIAISPLWSEVNMADASSTGTVHYRVGLTRSDTALLQAETMVKACYISQESFTATAGAVFTWDQVSDVPEAGVDVQQNSFQAILVYDTMRSFVIFHYSEISYLTNEITRGTQVGFNAGDVKGGMSFPFPKLNFEKLPDSTNCEAANRDGAYIFRVDTEIMTSPGCTVSQLDYALQVWPSSGPMMGGNKVFLTPICNLGVTVATCVFMQGDTVLQVRENQQIVEPALVCIPTPFFVTGDVSILVYQFGDDTTDPEEALYTHKYTIEHPDDSPVTVSRVSPTSQGWITTGSRLTISWDEDLFDAPATPPATPSPDNERLRISILQYDESVANREPSWEEVYNLGSNVLNTGTFSFTPSALENITQDNSWGVIRVQRMDGYPVALYSDVHMLGYMLHQEYQDDPEEWADAECRRWDAVEDQSNDNDGIPSYLDNVPPCPCTLGQAQLDISHFTRQRGGCATNDNDQSCTREGNDKICFLSIGSASGSECCYDDNNQLVFGLDDRTGGSSDKASMLGMPPYGLPGQTPYFSHWAVDVMPYQLCCRWGDDETCRMYLENRLPKGCDDYAERQTGFIFGDPHFITFDQRRYTFNGVGEYRMMEVSNVNFRMFGRTTMATDTVQGNAPVASFLNAVVMQETGSDVIHVELGTLRPLNIYINRGSGYYQPDLFLNDDDAYDPIYLRGLTLVVNSSDFDQIILAFETSKVIVVVTAWTYGISAEIIATKTDLPTSAVVTGLMGDMDEDPDNDIKNTNGVAYTGDDPEEIFDTVKEWVTTSSSVPKSHMDGKKKLKDYQNTTFVPILVTPDPSTLDPGFVGQIEATCNELAECIYDMSVTRSLEAGQDCYRENENYEARRQEELVKVESCSYIPRPDNGEVEFSDPSKKYAVDTTVTFSCSDEKLILSGPAKRTCLEGGTWSNDDMPRCSETNCDPSELKGVDIISTGFDANGNLQVVVGCPGTSVQNTLTCRGGSWEGPIPACVARGGGLSGGAIAGIVVGCLVGVALVVVLVVFLMRRRETGVKDLERSGTKVNAPAENWGMEEEGKNASASLGAAASNARDV